MYLETEYHVILRTDKQYKYQKAIDIKNKYKYLGTEYHVILRTAQQYKYQKAL